MNSGRQSRCPNCAAAYAPRARFCTACGRARDDGAEAEAPDPNRSVMLEPGRPRHRPRSRSASAKTVVDGGPPPDETPFVLPRPRAGAVLVVVVLFFGLVWVGRAINGPKPPPPHPAPPPAPAVTAALQPTPAEQKRFEAKAKRDLLEAQSYSEGLRAEAAAGVLRTHLQNGQAPPPSAEPKPYNTIHAYPATSAGN